MNLKRLWSKWWCWRGVHFWKIPGSLENTDTVTCADCGAVAPFKVNREPGVVTEIPAGRGFTCYPA